MNCSGCGIAVERKGYCPPCKTAYNKLWYVKNREVQLARVAKNNTRYKELTRRFSCDKKSQPCADCGKMYPPYVMDFDHRDGTKKQANVSRMVGTARTLWRVVAEAEKCDVVCANCHRERTHQRLLEAKSNAGVSPQFPKL